MSKENNIENKITLKLFAEGVGGLQRNGHDLVCPHQPPLQFKQMVQGIGGKSQEQVSIQKTSCNTSCPLTRVNSDNSIDVCCGGSTVTYKIEKVIGIADNPLKVVPMGSGGQA